MPEWRNIVTTAKAKSKVEYALRQLEKQTVRRGEAILIKVFREANLQVTSSIVDRIVDFYQREDKEDLFIAIGNGEIDMPENVEKFLNLRQKDSNNVILKYMKQAFKAVKPGKSKINKIEYDPIDTKKTYLLDQESFENNFKIATCCNPISGDKVLGFVRQDRYVDVHGVNCPVALKLKASHGDRLVNLEWSNQANFPFVSTVKVSGLDRMGILRDITEVLTNNTMNIKSMQMETNGGVFEGTIVLFVLDTQELKNIAKRLSQIKGVKSVNRIQKI